MAKESEAAQAAATKAPVHAAPETKTPEQWKLVAFPAGGKKKNRPHERRWQHDAAAALHGWTTHAHHAGAPMQLSGADYYEALVAASEPKSGRYVPHPAALSPHAGKV